VIGKSLGPYEILEPLGAGGMGEVYRARDTRLDRHVAIKILPTAVAADSDRLARLEREAKLLASLNHPNVASIYDMSEHDGIRYLVLEVVEGESLRDRLRRGPIPLGEAVKIGRQVARALKAARDEGIVHRDLKPANVMVTSEDSRVKVLDFGIAKVLTGDASNGASSGLTGTGTGAALGTTPYMSPEQLRGEAVDHRSDIWSFGCLMYETLAGRSPFARGSAAASVAAILESDPDWGALPSATPTGIRNALRRCLERDPARRYQDPSKLIAALEGGRSAGTGSGLRRWGAPVGAASLAAIAGLWAAGLLPGSSRAGTSPVAGPVASLAVLPFENLSGDTAQDYVALAMTEMLTTNLGKLPLRVPSRETAMEFRGSEQPSASIARQLGVDALVRGSLVTIGEDVQISVRLVDAREGDDLLWTESYAGTSLEIFGLMSESSATIAGEIGALTAEARQQLASSPRIDPRAEQLFWRGFTELENYTEEPIQTAIDAFSEAISIEPDYALAHAELGRAYLLAVQFGYLDSDETLALVRAAAEGLSGVTRLDWHRGDVTGGRGGSPELDRGLAPVQPRAGVQDEVGRGHRRCTTRTRGRPAFAHAAASPRGRVLAGRPAGGGHRDSRLHARAVPGLRTYPFQEGRRLPPPGSDGGGRLGVRSPGGRIARA
jgi:TolB-like protein/predicted Ser/Thr protein kinase